jgi:shikimate kinase
MEPRRRVVLTGPMAVGKSAVGRLVAQRTGSRFIDSDRVIVERHGPISTIFASQGEQAFRNLEAEVVREALESDDVVLSLGGGAVLHEGTRSLLRSATVVFLDTDLASVRQRISGDTGRPLLAGRPEDRWQELYDQRRPLYTSLASFVVDTRGQPVRAVTRAVLAALEADGGPAGVTGATPTNHLNHESGTNTHGD